MVTKLSMLVTLLCSFAIVYSQEIFKKEFSKTSPLTIVSATFDSKKNKVTLSIDDKEIGSKKSESKEDIREFVRKKLEEALSKKFESKAAEIISFSEKRANEVAQYISNPQTFPAKLEVTKLTDDYSLVKILSAANEFQYYLDHTTSEETEITVLFKKTSGKYVFDAAAIDASSAKDVIIENYPKITEQIKKQMALPAVSLVQTGGNYQLRFHGTSPEYISIKKEQGDSLKGKEISKASGSTHFELKTTAEEQKKEVKKEETKEENSKEEKKEAAEKKIGTIRINLLGAVYSMALYKKSGYFLKICGPAIDMVDNNGKKEPKKIKTDSCITGTDKISFLEENAGGFKELADDIIKKINKQADVNGEEYKKEIDKAYAYFAGKNEDVETNEKQDQFTANVLEQSHLTEIEKEKDTTTKVGTIEIPKKKLTLYHSDGSKEEVEITSVKFTIEEGKLQKRLIYVTTPKGIYTNKDAPIPLLFLRDRANDVLVNYDINNLDYIKLGDVLSYTDGGGYLPDDVDGMVLTPEDPKKDLYAASNLNSIINFSIYTDLAGLLGRRANGLLITDVTGRFITNSNNLFNGGTTVFSFIEPNLTIAKFDSKFRSLDSNNVKIGRNGEKDTVDRMYLNQIAWLKGSLKLNLFSFRVAPNQYLYINGAAQINVVNADTFLKKEKDVVFFNYFPEVMYSIKRLKNFGMDLSVKLVWQRLADSAPFGNQDMETIFIPQMAFFYYPSRNSNNRIYLRFNYWDNLSNSQNNFYQLQFGWKTSLKLSK